MDKLSNLTRSPKIILFKKHSIALLQNQQLTQSLTSQPVRASLPGLPAREACPRQVAIACFSSQPELLSHSQLARVLLPQLANRNLFAWSVNQIILPGQPARALVAQPASQSLSPQLGQPEPCFHSQPKLLSLASQQDHLTWSASQSSSTSSARQSFFPQLGQPEILSRSKITSPNQPTKAAQPWLTRQNISHQLARQETLSSSQPARVSTPASQPDYLAWLPSQSSSSWPASRNTYPVQPASQP